MPVSWRSKELGLTVTVRPFANANDGATSRITARRGRNPLPKWMRSSCLKPSQIDADLTELTFQHGGGLLNPTTSDSSPECFPWFVRNPENFQGIKGQYHTTTDASLNDASPVKKWCRGESMLLQSGKIFKDTRTMASFSTLTT